MTKVVDCPECNGTGKTTVELEPVEMDAPGVFFYPDAMEVICENCSGTSVIELTSADIIDLEAWRKNEGM
jgi:hypothetical protein